MPLQATSGAASYDAFGGGVAAVPNYIEDVFQTWLYQGNGSTQTITNGIDLAGKGGLVWNQSRSNSYGGYIYDTARGTNKRLQPFSTSAQFTATQDVTAFNSNGFTMGSEVGINGGSGQTYASWTFRKQPKFFDVVTYTGNGVAGRQIAHNLGSTPGCIIVKATSNTAEGLVYHQSLGNTKYLTLFSAANGANAADTWTLAWNDTSPTSTHFTVGSGSNSNADGWTYVAYLFAHNAGGFGLTGTDNVISCGSVTADGSGNLSVNLGYEPQWLMIKASSSTGNWFMRDVMRGMTVSEGGTNYAKALYANLSNEESNSSYYINPNATGFTGTGWIPGVTYIYIAIRRGPMKVPTSGTSVYTGVTRTGTGATANITSIGFPTDLVMSRDRQSADADFFQFFDRLRGPLLNIKSTQTTAENSAADSLTSFASMNGFSVGADTGQNGINRNTSNYVYECFRRAPSFFDEVCYTGDSTLGRAVPHNLGSVPELMIVKNRNNTENWVVYSATTGATKRLILNSTVAAGVRAVWADTTPTSTNFYVGGSGVLGETNYTTYTYVAYLFATCAGVSKVGSYTGTGTTKQVDCGFTGGARFVLIKRTDSTGDWYVWDSARGIVAGDDPYLLLNSTAAEVTNTDYVDTYSAGFEISSTAPAAINASGGTFIFLAIA